MFINGVEYTLGADPEVFVSNGGTLISAFGMIPGDKVNPFKVDKGAVQVDGMALEFNIEPVQNPQDWEDRIVTVMSILEGMLPTGNKIVIQSTANFGKDYIRSQPPKARELGCDPDYNAYTEDINPKPKGNMGIRTAAGHVHLGWINNNEDRFSDEHISKTIKLVKHMDVVLGVNSILEDPDNTRRSMYGKAGAFRIKPYGLEYRVLSNYWLMTKEHRLNIYNRVKDSIDNYYKDNFGHEVFLQAADIINSGNAEDAKHFKESYNI